MEKNQKILNFPESSAKTITIINMNCHQIMVENIDSYIQLLLHFRCFIEITPRNHLEICLKFDLIAIDMQKKGFEHVRIKFRKSGGNKGHMNE